MGTRIGVQRGLPNKGPAKAIPSVNPFDLTSLNECPGTKLPVRTEGEWSPDHESKEISICSVLLIVEPRSLDWIKVARKASRLSFGRKNPSMCAGV